MLEADRYKQRATGVIVERLIGHAAYEYLSGCRRCALHAVTLMGALCAARVSQDEHSGDDDDVPVKTSIGCWNLGI